MQRVGARDCAHAPVLQVHRTSTDDSHLTCTASWGTGKMPLSRTGSRARRQARQQQLPPVEPQLSPPQLLLTSCLPLQPLSTSAARWRGHLIPSSPLPPRTSPYPSPPFAARFVCRRKVLEPPRVACLAPRRRALRRRFVCLSSHASLPHACRVDPSAQHPFACSPDCPYFCAVWALPEQTSRACWLG